MAGLGFRDRGSWNGAFSLDDTEQATWRTLRLMTEPAIYLAPGASGGLASIDPFLRGMRALGHSATAITLPKGAAERAVPAYRGAVTEEKAVIGGQSFGGRVASLLVAEDPTAAIGLVLLS